MKYSVTILVVFFLSQQIFSQINLDVKINDSISKRTQEEVSGFLNRLYNVAMQKDTTALYEMIYENVINFNPNENDNANQNLNGFKQIWGLSEPQTSKIWTIIIDNINEGGFFDKAYNASEHNYDCITYFMPKAFIENPISMSKVSKCRTNIKMNLPIYDSPSFDSNIKGYMNIGTIICDGHNIKNQAIFDFYRYGYVDEWVHISTAENLSGWTQGKYFYKNGWVIEVQQVKGEWKITLFSNFE